MRKCGMWIAMCVLGLGAGAGTVTFPDLLDEMTNLEALSVLPDPGFTCKQFSSYDRRSTDPSVATDENWFANGDRGQHIQSEERNGATEWVMMDADGPGAIVRIWSANPNDAGIIRIYLDGSETPAVEMPLSDMLGGAVFPFTTPIAGERSKGWNCHLPIPYATHCKVTCSERDFYYHVNYRTYEPGTVIPSYSAVLAEKHRKAIEAVVERLAAPEPPANAKDAILREFWNGALAPGDTAESVIDDGGAIVRINTRIEAEDVAAALRGCWLEIFFDGETSPSVAAPLGDFYGTAPGLNPYQSLTCGVLPSGEMYANWVMPFMEGARVRVTNHTVTPVTLAMSALLAELPWHKDSMYFNAAWRAEFEIPTIPRQDWNFIEVNGAGRFVGDNLHVTNPSPAWWGEGDEKIYVDNEKFPSHFGTGSEDYFGYAWCSPDLFTHAYHNQPRCDGPGNYGHTDVSRFHVLDVIPFTEAFKFDIEVWHWADVKVNMAATSYWYEKPGGTDNRPALDPVLLHMAELPSLPRVEGALEGEDLVVVSKTGGETSVQQSVSPDWSNVAQLWWTQAEEDAGLVLGFPVEKAGTYEVRVVLTKARDYGIVTLAVNDGEPGEPVDLYNDGVVVTPAISLGTHELSEGQNTVTVTITGTNPQAEPARMFGIDYVKLVAKE